MGEKTITTGYDESEMRSFTRSVLNDLQALATLIDSGLMEEEVWRIGAEQEMFLVDPSMHPSPIVTELMNTVKDGRLTTEIGKFNLEANLTPREFTGSCLSDLEAELNDVLQEVRKGAAQFDSALVLTGILPTIQLSDLTEENLTPNPRYHEINRIVTKLHGKDRQIHLKGLDEIQLTLHDTFIEFCNTSFQIHLQVGASQFPRYYNWAQAISGPVLASAVNSPILLNNRLWHESRIALFQHATDTRSEVLRERNQMPRVNFGDDWVKGSILEVLREDAVRFRILLTQRRDENSLEMIAHGKIPELYAWRLHNGTIWRWNRPCYGIINGKPGLRIEARYLPSGPTVVDEVANAAFFLGLMKALPEEFGDVEKLMPFDSAKTNFFNAARYGLNSQTLWLGGKSRRTDRLILEELLPRAEKGLEMAGVDGSDIKRLLGILEARVSSGKTGAQWMLDSIGSMDPKAKLNVRMRSLVAAMKENQEKGLTLADWPIAEVPHQPDWIDNYMRVEQFMSTDLFTVRPEDVVDLAASLMHWKHVRHVPVENDDGELIGIISHRDLLEIIALGKVEGRREIPVSEIMQTDLVTVPPETGALEALNLMRDRGIGCLPVVKGNLLVGLVTAFDYLTVSSKLFEEKLAGASSSRSIGKTNAR